MCKFIVYRTNGLFGILDDRNESVVPCTHFSKNEAIEEWGYFLTLNVSKPFLDKYHNLTLDEIQTIKQQLINQLID